MNDKANLDIRQDIKSSGLFQWQIAAELGMHDSNFCRMLRFELSEREKDLIYEAIEKIEARRLDK